VLEFPSRHRTALLKTIDNAHPKLQMRVEHRVDLPELCPYSHNPAKGSHLWIRYQGGEQLLELFALEQYILGFHGHTIVRDMEYFVQEVAIDCSAALGTTVEVFAELEFNGVAQGQRVTVVCDGSYEATN
jgi:NADPH-dependent 7-cyano-7-deazaguanine reductase QueF